MIKAKSKSDFVAAYQEIVGYLYDNPTEVDVELLLLELNELTGQLAKYIFEKQTNG